MPTMQSRSPARQRMRGRRVMIIEQSEHIVRKSGRLYRKDEIIKKVLMTIYAGIHSSGRFSGGGKDHSGAGVFQEPLDWIIRESSLRRIRFRRILPGLLCSTGRPMSLYIMKARQTATFCWRMRSTVLRRRRRQPFWRPWRRIMLP